MTSVTLVGNPNCGKSTLFNSLTGARQKVGNWPGVTVSRTTGTMRLGKESFDVIDLPGLYTLDASDDKVAVDEEIARQNLLSGECGTVVNIVDATSLARGLFLTTQLCERNIPLVVAVNMIDVAKRRDIEVDCERLSAELGCPVVPISARRREGINELKEAIAHATSVRRQPSVDTDHRYSEVDRIVHSAVSRSQHRRTRSELIDNVVLNKYLAFPIFLLVMYLLFLFTINVGSAFIDFFDIAAGAIFVETPRAILTSLGSPNWLTTFFADGVGGGIQLVATFVPVIACLFLFLAVLEDSGYMGRVAFIMDRLMKMIGLPGKSFVPLIVGFGCNVPSVMATRNLENQPDRVLTTLMAPYMSCGARLTVYVLFASAFFPSSGQNVVFALYFIGIAVAVASAWIARRHLLPQTESSFVMELPPYHLPTIRGVLTQTWHRLSGFVTRAGKAIVLVVIVLNFVNSIGTDGSFGNEDSENSVLSEIGRFITPAFAPMGIDDDNWPATVGIFTGMFAKEVVVGTLDALYSSTPPDDTPFDFLDDMKTAVITIPENLSTLGDALGDPLGIDLAPVTDLEESAVEQGVEINTVTAMQNLFHGQLGAFSYLLFILLYMPCFATIGVIYKELGAFWAAFSTVWSVVVAYAAAVICYQMGSIGSDPISALIWIALVTLASGIVFASLIFWGKKKAPEAQGLIPVQAVD